MTEYCRTQHISQILSYFAFEKLPDYLLSGPINLKSCPKSQGIHQKSKNLTQQLNHYRGLESKVFVTRLPLELCQK